MESNLALCVFPFSFLHWFQKHKDELWTPMGSAPPSLVHYTKEISKNTKENFESQFFLNFKLLNIFISCLTTLVCIPEALTDLLTPILPYITSTNVACQMRHLCQKCQKCHIWRICLATHIKYIRQYGCQKMRQDLRNADQCH